MPRIGNQPQESITFNQFENHPVKGVRLISGFSRFLSSVLPSYFQRKVDSAATKVLHKLKNDYMKGDTSPTKRTKHLQKAALILSLNPSQEIASEINAFAYPLFNKEVRAQNLNPFHVTIDPALSQRLETLGLSVEQQRKYPELMKMIVVNDLADYMEGVNYKINLQEGAWEGTELRFNSADHDEPVLLINGQFKPWSEARTEIFGTEINESTSWKLPDDPENRAKQWRFDSRGITSHSMANWDTLTNCGKLRNHDGKYYLDIMSTTEGLNHNWIRLVNSDGEVISAGLCGEIYSMGMMRSSVGKLNSPDHREFFRPETHRSTRIAIDAETYRNLKENKLEADQRTNNLFFSLLTRNCSKYACEVAVDAGLNLDNTEFTSQLILRSLLHRVNLFPPKIVLKTIQKLTFIPRMLFGMGLAFVMGAWYQNADVKALENNYYEQWRNKPKKPFRSFRSYFNGTNSMMASSMKVGAWQDYVQAYRIRRAEFLNEQKALYPQHHNTPAFERAWSQLEYEVTFGMPPELNSSHLFLNNARNVPTEDVQQRIATLVETLS